MKTVAAIDYQNRLEPVLDAAQDEPLVIRNQDQDVAVVLSMSEYDRLRSTLTRAYNDLHDRVEAEAVAVDLMPEDRLAALMSDDEG